MSLHRFARNGGVHVRDTHFCAKKTVSLTGIGMVDGTVDGAEMETEWEERTGDGAEREM